jgi:hypothetical protein
MEEPHGISVPALQTPEMCRHLFLLLTALSFLPNKTCAHLFVNYLEILFIDGLKSY